MQGSVKEQERYKIGVLGLGYVGLTYAIALASRGFDVIGIDIDESKVKLIKHGKMPFYEPGLEKLLVNVINERLNVTTNYYDALSEANVVFMSVGTPSKPDGSCELKYVIEASKMIGEVLKNRKEYQLIVVKSTVPPGTTEKIVKETIEKVSNKLCGKDFGLCMNPEFLREGKALEDILKPSRIVIGEYDRRSGDVLEEFYRKFYGDNMPPIIRTSIVNAELIKYASNAFLSMKISFINLIAQMCQRIPKADVVAIADGIGLDPRIGRSFLNAGLGFGGSCLPKDLKALIKFAQGLNVNAKLFEAILEINEKQIAEAINLIRRAIGELKGKTIAVLGLAFKGGTDDIRESQAIKLVKELAKLGATVKTHDPKALRNAMAILKNTKNVHFYSDIYECVQNCNVLVIATDWNEYKRLDFERIKHRMKYPIIVDCRRILNYQKISSQGLKYLALGLSTNN